MTLKLVIDQSHSNFIVEFNQAAVFSKHKHTNETDRNRMIDAADVSDQSLQNKHEAAVLIFEQSLVR